MLVLLLCCQAHWGNRIPLKKASELAPRAAVYLLQYCSSVAPVLLQCCCGVAGGKGVCSNTLDR